MQRNNSCSYSSYYYYALWSAAVVARTVWNELYFLHPRICALESMGCNVSSGGHVVNESEVLEIVCEVRYGGEWWTPVIRCLLGASDRNVANNRTVISNSSIGTIVYRDSVNVTSWMNGSRFNCHVSFESTSDNASSSSSIHAPASIHLWTLPEIYVKGYYFIEQIKSNQITFICFSS